MPSPSPGHPQDGYFPLRLLSFTLVLGLAVAALIWFERYNNKQERYVQSVSKHIRKFTEEQQAEVALIGASSANAFPLDTHFPYVVFEHKKLVFWSDYHFVPTYELLAGRYTFAFIQLQRGKYIACRAERGGREVFSFIPLYQASELENAYLSSGLNTELLPDRYGLRLNGELSTRRPNVFAQDGTFLFSLELSQPLSSRPLSFGVVLGWCLLLGAAFWVQAGLRFFARRRIPDWGFLLLPLYLLALRWYMIAFGLPYQLAESDLFDSKIYASSRLAPSLGDLLLNYLAGFVGVIYLLRYFRRSLLFNRSLRLPLYGRLGLGLGMAALTGQLIYLPYAVVRNLYWHSALQLDITQSLDFSLFRLIALLVFVLACGIFFMSVHIAAYWLSALLPARRLRMAAGGSGLLLFMAGGLYLGSIDGVLLLISAAYLLGLLGFGLSASLYRLGYLTSLYLFTGTLTAALTGAYTIEKMEEERQNSLKQRLGQEWISERDVEGEYLLRQSMESIQADKFIKVKLGGVFPPLSYLQRQIRKEHLNTYFDRYEVGVFIFDRNGIPLLPDDLSQTYQAYQQLYAQASYQTDYPGLYFIRPLYTPRNGRHYVVFVPIGEGAELTGYVMLDLLERGLAPGSAYPELLVDRLRGQLPRQRQGAAYSYAIFEQQKLRYSQGSFNYLSHFPLALLERAELRTTGLEAGGMDHLLVKDPKGSGQVVVSSPRYESEQFFSNTSFLFLILILVSTLVLVVYNGLSRSRQENTAYSTKIQIYLNLAFFMPLLVVSVVILNRFDEANRQNQVSNFLHKALSVSQHIRPELLAFIQKRIPPDSLALQLTRLARYSESDVNLFYPDGRLMSSSQPLIYDKNLLSPYINPIALRQIGQQQENSVLLPESIGRLRYSSVYVGIRDMRYQLLGILSIPFFEAQADSERQVRDLLATIINIFTAVFIIFLLVSYFASQVLTVPLRLITGKLQKTSLQDKNEPLEWKSDDEIGLLVGEYNRMLLTLEANKEVLAQQEKELAWREMARQVAHEIKNPLTPMKLTLQHLQRLLPEAKDTQLLSKSLATLMEQVDTLDQIASSFSTFARMPTPKSEPVDIGQVLRQTLDLYTANPQLDLEADLTPLPCIVRTDGQLMGRIFTNLLLNAIQSVPHAQRPHIRVGLQREGESVLLAFHDNGNGIPEALWPSIFQPNFSTKYAGSGIGLAVARQGIEQAGGSIWFESTPQQGTAFFIRLPLEPPG